jgi:transcriptional regulator GlxA family with amidase domain
MVAGLQTSATVAGFHGPGSAVEIELTPLGARRLLGMPLYHLAKSVVDPDDILGADWAEDITEQLAAAPHWPQRWRILDTVLSRMLSVATPSHPMVIAALDLLRDRGGAVSLKGLMEATGLGARRVQGLLREHVGLPAQTLSRILRFHRTLAMAANGHFPLSQLATLAGYHDQAHMSREVRSLSGQTPQELLGIMKRAPIRPSAYHIQPFNDFGLRHSDS